MMTEMLLASPDGGSHFSSGLMRRSSSTYPLFLVADPSYVDSMPKSTVDHTEYASQVSSFAPSPIPSSPQLSYIFSNYPSCASMLASSLSFDTKSEMGNSDIDFPSFDGPYYFDQQEDLEPPPPLSSVSND